MLEIERRNKKGLIERPVICLASPSSIPGFFFPRYEPLVENFKW